MRGKLPRGLGTGFNTRLIPACAGKTSNSPTNSLAYSAHPRVCGENLRWVDKVGLFVGSSPRVRGKLQELHIGCAFRGLIPACAGKTSLFWVCWLAWWAHPRVCGENPTHVADAVDETGSSPRVRGKLTYALEIKASGGLIPACAGKTSDPPISPLSHRTHPRVCGENRIGVTQPTVAEGSSPRVRGKRDFVTKVCLVCGLIPACAGKTPKTHTATSRYPAHPRVCGENLVLGFLYA